MSDACLLLLMETTTLEGMTLDKAETAFRIAMVKRALKLTRNHHQKAAKLLGVHRNTLTRVMTEAGMELDPRRGGHNRNKGNALWQALGTQDRSQEQEHQAHG
jgi:hypothetical protein